MPPPEMAPVGTRQSVASEAPPGLGRRRWSIGVLLGVGILINYFDRVNISVAAPQLQQEFGLTPVEIGLLFSAFFWSYAILQVPVGHGARPLRRHDRQPHRRVSLGRRVGRRRARHRLRHDIRGADPARRRRGAGVSGQLQGDRLLVPAQRALAGDGDLRRGGEVLQRHRRAAGGPRGRHVRLALGLRTDGAPELRLLRRLLVHLSRSERRHEAQPRGAGLYSPGRRDARGDRRGEPLRHARLPPAQPQGVGADDRLRGLRLLFLSVPHLAPRLSGRGDAHEHHQVRRLRGDSLALRHDLRPRGGRLARRQDDRSRATTRRGSARPCSSAG